MHVDVLLWFALWNSYEGKFFEAATLGERHIDFQTMNSLTVFESGASSDVLRYSSTEVWISCGFSLEDGVRLRIATRVGSELGSPQLASQIGNSVMTLCRHPVKLLLQQILRRPNFWNTLTFRVLSVGVEEHGRTFSCIFILSVFVRLHELAYPRLENVIS